MLLLTQNGHIVNLDRMATVDTSSLQIYARQGTGERGIILGGYNTEARCYEIIRDIFATCEVSEIYSMPKD